MTTGKEDILKFTNSVILLSKLFARIEDKFLKQKLHGKISDFVSAFIEQKSIHSPEYVAQSRHKDLINAINNLIDYLEHLAHISKNNTTPLFLAQINLLKFKLHILKQKRRGKTGKALTSDACPVGSPAGDSFGVVNSSIKKPRFTRLALRSNSNKELIFNFIKKTPDVRTKEVMSKFSALSSRTVKRSLKELTDEGFLKKRSDGAAMYYIANSD